MTRMAEQKQRLLSEAIKNLKALKHLTGDNAEVVAVAEALEGLKVIA